MKKLLLSLIALLGIGVYAMADEVTVETAQVRVGNSGVMRLVLTTDKTDYYRDFQFTLELPAGITVKEIVDEEDATVITHGTTGDACSSKHVLASNIVQSEPQIVNYVVNTLTGNKIKSGILANVTLIPSNSLSVGNTLQGKVTGIEITDDQNGKHEFGDVTFNIEIVENLIVLDEESASLPEAEEGANVKVLRTINANEWSTICLPFDMNEAQLTSAFGSDVKLAYFVDYSTTSNNTAISAISINFGSSSAQDGLIANYPYLIQTSKNISEFVVEGISVNPNEEGAIAKYGTTDGPKTVVKGSFIGTLHAGEAIPANGLFLNGNKFYYSTGATTIKAFRGYFVLTDVLTDKDAEARMILNIDGQTTRVEGISSAAADTNVYTLDGRRVSRTPQTKGVFIQNGKKVVK